MLSMSRDVYNAQFGEEPIHVEFDVEYSIDRGYPQTYEEPGQPACVDEYTVTITSEHDAETTAALKLYLETEECESIDEEIMREATC